MKILSQSVYAKRKQVMMVHVDCPANVKFFTPEEYKKYKKGLTHSYWGGYTDSLPARFEIPRKGRYYAVVEKGTFNSPVSLSAHVEITPPQFDYMNGLPQNETHTEVEGEYDDTLE